jgi:asparagine N-glycosylation enzyme membrane subunit Stt3
MSERFSSPPEDPVAVEPGRVRDVGRRDVALRFAFGAVTSALAGIVSALAGASWAGPFLALPAILAASLTLIADEESGKRAREDSRGAVLGAVALVAFAAVGAAGFGRIGAAWVLLLAGAAWCAVAGGLYWLLWARRRVN